MTTKIDTVQRMQNYIEAHLCEEISLIALAEEVHFSPWYSARIFKELTELSPADYIRRLKLSKSALRLRDENIKIIDIAFDMGFASVDGYQCLWLPEGYRKPNTSIYVQGVEVALDFHGQIPEGFDVIGLPSTKYLMFQGEPFAEEDYCEAIESIQNSMDKYNPSIIGYKWDDENPRIQLEPIGQRGYIELRAIK